MWHRARNLRARWAELPPALADGLPALLLYAVATLEVQLSGAPDAIAGQAVMLIVAAGLALRRRAPLAAIAAAMAGVALLGLLSRELIDGSGTPWLVTIYLVYRLAVRTEAGPRLAAGAAIVAIGASVSTLVDADPTGLSDFVFIAVVFIAAPMAAGQLIRSRAALNRALREKAARAGSEHARLIERAASDERARIAGELHDVVAHALGAMTVQATAARRMAARDPERACQAFRAVETTGRDALCELRRLLGVLRRDDEELALSPQPRLAHLGDLARRTRAAGLRTELLLEGPEPDALPPGVDLTGYRFVQEALGKARADGAGRCAVHVRYLDDAVEVEVVDDGPANSEPVPLGIRERVQLYGGAVEAATTSVGHRLRARLPLETAP